MRMKIRSFWVTAAYGGVEVADQELGLLGNLVDGAAELDAVVLGVLVVSAGLVGLVAVLASRDVGVRVEHVVVAHARLRADSVDRQPGFVHIILQSDGFTISEKI